MSLPAVDDLVTVLFNGDSSGTVNNAYYGVVGKIVNTVDGIAPHALWKPLFPRETNYIVREEFEGICWARGIGPEVEAALIATFVLWSSR